MARKATDHTVIAHGGPHCPNERAVDKRSRRRYLPGEKVGHSVIPLLAPSNNPFYAMSRVVYDLNVQKLIVGKSGKYPPQKN